MGKFLQVLLACCLIYVVSAVSYDFGIPPGFRLGAPGYLISPTGQRYFDPYWCQRGKVDPITIYRPPIYRPPVTYPSYPSYPSFPSYPSYPTLPSGCGPEFGSGGSGGYFPYQTQQYAPQSQVQYSPQVLPPQQQVSIFGGQQPEQPSLSVSSSGPITTFSNPDDRSITTQPFPYPGSESSQNLQVLPGQGQDQMTTLPYPPPQQTYSGYQQYSQGGGGGMQTLPYPYQNPGYSTGGGGGMQTLPYYGGGTSYYSGQYQPYQYGQQQQQQQPQQQQELQVQPQQQQG